VVRVGSMRNTYEILIGKPEQSSSLGRHGRGREGNGRLQRPVDSFDSGYRPISGSYVHGKECSGSIKGRKFIDWLSDY
jgi:hypothetical protein